MIQKKIIEGLISNDDFLRHTKPYLKEAYFKDFTEKFIFKLINEYVDKYNKCPNTESLQVDLSNSKELSEDQ